MDRLTLLLHAVAECLNQRRFKENVQSCKEKVQTELFRCFFVIKNFS